jgi:two-component system, cell cycle response regulator DivK
VDDQRELRELWDCWLTSWGFEIHQAQNGLDAVRSATAHPPQLILMDIEMPVMDGWRATELLKAAPQTAHIPIVVLTGLGTFDDSAARAKAVGCDAFLRKPCKPLDLVQQIREVLGRPPRRPGRLCVQE